MSFSHMNNNNLCMYKVFLVVQFHLRVCGVPLKNRDLLKRVRLGGVIFADDTCCRLSTCQAQALLRNTLEQWGEKMPKQSGW